MPSDRAFLHSILRLGSPAADDRFPHFGTAVCDIVDGRLTLRTPRRHDVLPSFEVVVNGTSRFTGRWQLGTQEKKVCLDIILF